jgi:hypothetical protein
MAELNVQKVVLGGLDPAFSAADAAGDTFINNGRTFFHFKNGGTAAITATINSVTPCNHGFDHDVAISVPAGDDRIVGPFPAQRFNDLNNKVSVAYSAVTSVTVAAIKN